MKSLPPITPDLVALERWLASCGELRAAWLFGSRGRGDARPQSDVDLGVSFQQPPPDVQQATLALQVDAARALGVPAEAVDVVAVDEAPPLLRQAIFRDGALLLDRDPRYRVALQVRTLHEAEEARRLWEERRRVRARQLGVGR